MMKHAILLFSIVAAALLVSGCEQETLVSPQLAHSEQSITPGKAPQPASGNFTVVSVIPTSLRPAGNNCILEADVIFSFTGSFAGSFSPPLPLRIVHRGPCDPFGPAPETFQGQGTFSGTVDAVSGTFDFNFRGSADEQGNAQAKITVLQGAGGLATLHGTIRLTGITGVGGTYSGSIH